MITRTTVGGFFLSTFLMAQASFRGRGIFESEKVSVGWGFYRTAAPINLEVSPGLISDGEFHMLNFVTSSNNMAKSSQRVVFSPTPPPSHLGIVHQFPVGKIGADKEGRKKKEI
jgi:hypothetical protein